MALNATVRQFNGAPQLEPAQTMVAINKVTMSFGEFTAVRDVDIQVGDGEFLAIVGPTGCGKSTILNSVAGLLKPSSGQVSIDGRAVSGVQESVGYLFQQDALLPWKTAYQNVELGLRFRGVPEAERKAKANAWLAKVGLAGFEHRYPHQLSGGQRKRVQMAQALIVEPKVILMDEPFSALDIHTRHLMQNELLRLWQEDRRSVILITHDLEEAIALGIAWWCCPPARPAVSCAVSTWIWNGRATWPRSSWMTVSPTCTATSGPACAAKWRRAMHAKTDKFIQLALVVAVFGGWEGGIALGVIDPFFFPSPTAIVQQAWTWLSDTSFYQHVYITLTETALGYIIGTGLGVAGGVWLGLSRRSARILDPFIKGFNAIPRVVLAPIFVLWLGLGLWSKVALAVTLVFFTTFFNAMQGVREVNPVVLANARILGASRSDLLRHVYFPQQPAGSCPRCAPRWASRWSARSSVSTSGPRRAWVT